MSVLSSLLHGRVISTFQLPRHSSLCLRSLMWFCKMVSLCIVTTSCRVFQLCLNVIKTSFFFSFHTCSYCLNEGNGGSEYQKLTHSWHTSLIRHFQKLATGGHHGLLFQLSIVIRRGAFYAIRRKCFRPFGRA